MSFVFVVVVVVGRCGCLTGSLTGGGNNTKRKKDDTTEDGIVFLFTIFFYIFLLEFDLYKIDRIHGHERT